MLDFFIVSQNLVLSVLLFLLLFFFFLPPPLHLLGGEETSQKQKLDAAFSLSLLPHFLSLPFFFLLQVWEIDIEEEEEDRRGTGKMGIGMRKNPGN